MPLIRNVLKEIRKDRAKEKQKLSWKTAALCIMLSCLVILGPLFIGLKYYQYLHEQKKRDPKYLATLIIQSCAQKEALPTEYLTELLDLSLDKPENIYNLSYRKMMAKLKRSVFIKDANIMISPPSFLYVDYSLRVPVARLKDILFSSVDNEGHLIPCSFKKAKELPEIFLGLQEDCEMLPKWGASVQCQKLDFAFYLLSYANQLAQELSLSLISLDVSLFDAKSFGKREVILTFKDVQRKGSPASKEYFLRLNPKDALVGLNRFKLLILLDKRNKLPKAVNQENELKKNRRIFDMRHSSMGLIS